MPKSNPELCIDCLVEKATEFYGPTGLKTTLGWCLTCYERLVKSCERFVGKQYRRKFTSKWRKSPSKGEKPIRDLSQWGTEQSGRSCRSPGALGGSSISQEQDGDV